MIFLLFISSLFASQGVQVSDPDVAAVTIPATTGWNNLTSFRIEGQIDTCTNPVGGDVPLVDLNGGMSIRLNTTGGITVRGFGSENTTTTITRADCGNLRFRARRDITATQYTLELWDEVTGVYELTSVTMTDTATKDLGGGSLYIGKSFGAIYPSMTVGALRIYSSAGTVAAAPPARLISSSYADLVDWEFEGNLTDNSGRGMTLVFSAGAASYAASTTLPPIVSMSAVPTTVRAGTATTFNVNDSFSNNDNPAFTLSFSTSGPYSATRIMSTSSAGTISLPAWGEYSLIVTITDASGPATYTALIGAVATDNNGLVIVPDANISRILGPLPRMDTTSWSWFDDRAVAAAELQITLQTTGGPAGTVGPWRNVWSVASMNGTISVTNGSATVTGTSTDFQDDFCDGGGTPVSGTDDFIAIWYEDANYPGEITRAFYRVTACASATSMTLQNAWGHATGTQSGLSYTVVSGNQIGYWFTTNTPGNYYDNVLAFYTLYYRTGLTRYRDAARTLARNFWEGPFYSRGRNYDTAALGGNFIFAGPARGQSPAGLVLWALESGEDIWDGLHLLWAWQKYVGYDAYSPGFSSTMQIGDVREMGYATAAMALCSQYDTDSGWQATCRTTLKGIVNSIWTPLQVPVSLNWRQAQAANQVWGPVTVTNGSTNVVLGSGTWGNTLFATYWVWFTPTATVTGYTTSAVGDSVYYTCTWVDSTHCTLDRNYEGTTSSSKYAWVSTLAAFGTQPFMLGIWGRQAGTLVYDSLVASGDTTEANIVKQFSIDTANWLIDSATDNTNHWIEYGVEYLNCSPPSTDPTHCGGSEVLNGEVMGNYVAAYKHSDYADTTIKDAADALFTRMWCKPTGGWTCATAGYGTYMSAIEDDPTGYMLAPNDPLSNKWFGFFFGYGAGTNWPVTRLGTPLPTSNLTVYLVIKIDTFPTSTKARITIVTADGESPTPTVCTASPCQVTIDRRIGRALVKIDYLNSSDVVLGTGSLRTLLTM
jgi:hypothetical protein